MTIRTPDFARLLDWFARGEGGQLKALLKEPLVVVTPRRRRSPENPQPKTLPAVDAQASGRFRNRTGRHGKDLSGRGGRSIGAPARRGPEARPDEAGGGGWRVLGFLPGDRREKILPYFRPLYHALNELLGTEDAARLTEKGVIEKVALAYMRRRTLSNAFVVLDEARIRRPSR